MPAAIAIPLITAAATGTASVISSRLQSNANRDASRTEADYNRRALEAAREEQEYRRRFDEDERNYRRQQATDYRSRLDPYVRGGADAQQRLNGLMYGSRYQPAGPQQAPVAPPARPSPAPAATATVLMRAPNGQTQQVPAAQVEHYAARGAVRV